jgi:hypothetical protein
MGISCGLQALEAMFKEDVESLCGPRYKHQEEKGCFRWGRTSGEVTVGGRKLKVSRPRVRDEEEEVFLPTYEYFKDDDPLKERSYPDTCRGVQGGIRDHWRQVKQIYPHRREQAKVQSPVDLLQ